MANLSNLVPNGPEELEKLSDDELRLRFAPYLTVTRVDPSKRKAKESIVNKATAKPKRRVINEEELMATLKKFGI